MRFFVVFMLALLPVVTFGYVSVVSVPTDEFHIFTINKPEVEQEFFGVLTNFPHTYSFIVEQKTDFKVTLFGHDHKDQKNDASMIIIKEEKRGVSEVGRTDAKVESWEVTPDATLSESFRIGGVLEAPLEPGVYRLEVSSPSNDAAYRLVLHDGAIERSFMDNVRVLFEIKKLYGSSVISSVLSPLMYLPIGIIISLLLIALAIWRVRSKRV